MALLDLTPSESSYRVGIASDYVATEVIAGAPRHRAVLTGAPHEVSVRWHTNAGGYTYLRQFHEVNNAIPFEIKLPLNSSRMETYTAYFQPGGFQLRRVQGNTYSIEAVLEIAFDDTAEFKALLDALLALYPTDLAAIIALTREAVVDWEMV